MQAVINHLIQLQELFLIRTEQKAHRQGLALDELNASIQALSVQLPEDVRRILPRMQMRDPLFIAPVAHGVCAGCGMRLPISLVQDVHRAEAITHCPVCTRILYYTESAPRNVGKSQRRCEPRKIGISRFSADTLMIPRLDATTRDGAIRELAMVMCREGFVDDVEKLCERALRRESVVSTAVEPCLAFPHARGVEGGGLTLALGISHKGIRFSTDEKSLTKMVFFMAIPTAASVFYLKLLAGLAETFVDAENRKLIMASDTAEKMWKSLLKTTRKTVP